MRGRGEGDSEAGRRTGGEKEVRDGEVKELFIQKVLVHSLRMISPQVTATLGKFRVFYIEEQWDTMAAKI